MNKKIIRSFMSALLFSFIFICCLPTALLCITSCVNTWIYPNILPNDYTFEYFRYVLISNEIIKAIITSIILGILCGIITIFVSIPTARVLALYNFRGKLIINILVLLPLIVPSFTIVSITHINMIKASLDGTILGVSIIHTIFALPYAIRLIYDQTLAIGVKYEQQAQNLGASPISSIFSIYLPLISPSIILAFFLTFTISISQYVTTLIIGGGKIVTLSTLLIPYIQYGNYQIASIYSIILIIISFVGYFFISQIERKLVN